MITNDHRIDFFNAEKGVYHFIDLETMSPN